MDEAQALAAFAALSQETRLRIVRLLVTAGPDGLAAGTIGEAMGGASSSRMSFHLGQLQQAGLVTARREGRFILYSAALPRTRGACRLPDARLLPGPSRRLYADRRGRLLMSIMTMRPDRGAWPDIAALGLTQIIGYGTLYYSFGILAPAMAHDLGWPE